MSEVPTRVEINCETGEQTIIPLTAEEITQMEADRIAYEEAQAAAQAEADAKEAARQSGIAKLMVLGLTEEEAQALVK
jgi:hypothetical protein